MEHFRAVCARTRDTVARNAKFNGSVERLFDVERRLGGNAVAALDVSTLADLGEAAERALHALGDWRAASVTNRMKGHDADVESALAELCARGVEVAAEAERAARGETSDIVVPAIPAVPERDAVVSTSSSTDPPPFPPTIPTPMRRHPPASAAAAAHPRTEAVPEIPRGGGALSTAAAADANAAYTAALESEASGHTHIALERLAPLAPCVLVEVEQHHCGLAVGFECPRIWLRVNDANVGRFVTARKRRRQLLDHLGRARVAGAAPEDERLRQRKLGDLSIHGGGTVVRT